MRITRIVLVLVSLAYFSFLAYIFFVRVIGTDRSTYFVNPDDHIIPFNSTKSMLRDVKHNGVRSQATQVLIVNVVGNLLLFVPLGLMLPLYHNWCNRWQRVLIICLLFSGAIETTQFLFSIGVFDIDDIIYNTVGGLIGFLVFRVIAYFFGYRRPADIPL